MILLENCLYVYKSFEDGGCWNCDILIDGRRILKIGKNLSKWLRNSKQKEPTKAEGAKVLDCSGMIAIPGLINTHHHFYQTLTRNIPAVQNAKLFDWLVYLYEIWKGIDEEAVLYSSMLAIGELLKTGCTCTTDHHYLYPKGFSGDLMGIQFEAAKRLGIRFAPTRGSMSRSEKDGGLPPDSVVQNEDEILEDSRRVIEKYHDVRELSMQRIILAPCSPFSVSPELLRDSARLARLYGVKLHTHLAETEDEDDYCVNTLGIRPLKFMEKYEFIGSDVFYAHGIHFNDDELRILQVTETSIAHCPTSNMRLGSGIARVKEMVDMGITVGLGVDGSASNDSSDMLGELRNAMLLQRVRYGADALGAREVMKLATENGAKILGFNKIGKLKEGYGADIAVFDLNKLEYAGSLSDPLAALVFSGYNHGSYYTIVNGKIVVDKGRLVGVGDVSSDNGRYGGGVWVDEEEIRDRANQISMKLLKKL